MHNRCQNLGARACYVGEGNTVTLDVSNDMLCQQVTVIGHWTFSKVWQAESARFIADRDIDVDKLFTHRWRIDQAEEAYKLFNKQVRGKV